MEFQLMNILISYLKLLRLGRAIQKLRNNPLEFSKKFNAENIRGLNRNR